MALFAAAVLALLIIFRADFLRVAVTNIWINGAIIGVALFGGLACFADMFRLLPEYKWMKNYFRGAKYVALPPVLLRPIAIILRDRGEISSPTRLNSMLEMILNRFEDSRESIRYITNLLIFLGLLGTFWGLINTIGGFADLIGGMDFMDENVMTSLQTGLTKPLSGMSVAFTSSLLGLAGSLIVGFFGLQVQMAQNGIFRELEEKLSRRTAI